MTTRKKALKRVSTIGLIAVPGGLLGLGVGLLKGPASDLLKPETESIAFIVAIAFGLLSFAVGKLLSASKKLSETFAIMIEAGVVLILVAVVAYLGWGLSKNMALWDFACAVFVAAFSSYILLRAVSAVRHE